MNPRTIAFMYKQFSQYIIKYGFENIYLSDTKIRMLNVRQNFLFKNVLDLSIYNRTKPLLQLLKVEQITQLYLKHKIFFFKQIYLNSLSLDVLKFCSEYYRVRNAPKASFAYQLKQVSDLSGHEVTLMNLKESINSIVSKFICNDQELNEQLKTSLNNFKIDPFFLTINILRKLLWVEF